MRHLVGPVDEDLYPLSSREHCIDRLDHDVFGCREFGLRGLDGVLRWVLFVLPLRRPRVTSVHLDLVVTLGDKICGSP